MEFLCCWLYAIDRYGFPPSIPDTLSALREIKQMGFSYAELEGVSGPNLVSVYEHRHEIKDLVTDWPACGQLRSCHSGVKRARGRKVEIRAGDVPKRRGSGQDDWSRVYPD